MQVSSNCINIIKECEGFRSKPYKCPAGVATIGYGSTRYLDGKPVKMTDAPITEAQAADLMKLSLREYEAAVLRYVKAPINQNQFDALVDFAYNVGAQNLRSSTLLRLLNLGQYSAAASEFGKWAYAAGKKMDGLVKRRKLEQNLFMKP